MITHCWHGLWACGISGVQLLKFMFFQHAPCIILRFPNMKEMSWRSWRNSCGPGVTFFCLKVFCFLCYRCAENRGSNVISCILTNFLEYRRLHQLAVLTGGVSNLEPSLSAKSKDSNGRAILLKAIYAWECGSGTLVLECIRKVVCSMSPWSMRRRAVLELISICLQNLLLISHALLLLFCQSRFQLRFCSSWFVRIIFGDFTLRFPEAAEGLVAINQWQWTFPC